MKVVIDIEANGLINPTKVWLIVCKELETNEYFIFRKVSDDQSERERFLRWTDGVELFVGHNVLGYDYPVLSDLLGWVVPNPSTRFRDTLLLSKLIDFPRKGHSVEDYGEEFGLQKGEYPDWSKYSPEMEEYCIRDVDITQKIWEKYLKYISNPKHAPSIQDEHAFQWKVVNKLHENGFYFDKERAQKLLHKVVEDLAILDKDILQAFPIRSKLIREVVPKATQFGTISKASVPRALASKISEMTAGAGFSYITWVEFNPSSHKQLVDVLWDAGWQPVDKTATHVEALRSQDETKLPHLERYGWKINENNLVTLPDTAPKQAHLLAKRIMLEARRRTLTEWLGLIDEDSRIRGSFYGIGAWTHRMSHQRPNTANIPNDYDINGKVKLLGGEMRALWRAPKNKLLVGVDAEGIQLRIFAHLINDAEFTHALVSGKKEDKSDPHSLNQRVLGSICKTRAAAKRFIFALLLGGGISKLAQILEASQDETQDALDRILERYTGFANLKSNIIPADARRGWFVGLDGRRVRIPGETASERRHLAMSGYLQNGEKVVMMKATLRWMEWLEENHPTLYWKLVNFVHDEWQTEVRNSLDDCHIVAKAQADSLVWVGEYFNLNCPLSGSYWNEDKKDFTFGTNWRVTH